MIAIGISATSVFIRLTRAQVLAAKSAVIAEASLSFLGLGQQPPAPSWGSMLNTARNYVDQAPWMAIWPGVSIFLLVLSFNLLGDGLHDALDPRHK
jgi:peptide/nickel transport system permease protein